MSLVYLNVCRLCAGSCENLIPIFENTGILNIAEKIKCYLHIDIKNSNDANDDPRMCDACYTKIVSWDEYVEQVQKVQGMFMSLSDMKSSNTILESFCEKVTTINEKVEITNNEKKLDEKSVTIDSVGSMQVEETSPKSKHLKKLKKVKKKIKISIRNESDFSEEDDIPLSNQLDSSSDGIKNKIEEKGKEVKPRIKLKIKTIKSKEPKEPENILKPGETAIQNTNEKEVEGGAENSSDGNEYEEKEENKVKMSGLHSLFSWECLECHTPVKNWNALVKHCREIHNSNASVQCVCGKFLQSRASIMKHRMTHTVGYGYKCEFENCNKTFHRQQLLDVHTLSHMPKELQPWMCCKCSRRFHTESLLKQHEKVHLPKEEKLIHPCEVCQKKFCSKSAVSAHIRAVHFGERPFVCDQCGHSFTSKGILHEHLTIHSDVYNFHCKDCNKSFKTKYRLKIHMDTHVATRYQCPVCTLTLNTRRTLRMHLLVHKDVKAFLCITCGKGFKRSKDLKNHYNLHTGRRPYVCPFCHRTFANGSNCRSHKRRMHPEELKLYEAALAAGQEPIIFQANNQEISDTTNMSLQQTGSEYLEDSNGSKSDPPDTKYKNCKYSDEEDKPVSLVPYNEKCRKAEEIINGTVENGNKYKLLSPEAMPLNLQRNYSEELKKEDNENENEAEAENEEDEEEVEEEVIESIGLNSGENIAQISFESQPENVQYPVHNFYTFQSCGIPAFPGNPFFRQ